VNADELLEAARTDFSRGFTVRAGTRLRQACDAGSSEALVALTDAVIHGRVPGDVREIRKRLETADTPTPEARRLRARWRYAGIGGERSRPTALEDLTAAAGAGDTSAQIEMALAWGENRDETAQGQVTAWLSRARRMDLLETCEASRYKTADEAEPLSDWATPASPDATRRLSEDPAIWLHEALLSPLECTWLQLHATASLAPSRVYDPRSGQAIDDPIRTGRTACLDPSLPGIFDLRIAERMAAAAKAESNRAEPLAVLCYEPGQEYKPHYDWLGSGSLARDPLRHAGDRVVTVLGYLNTPKAGGATYFPRLDIRVPARQGQVLVFFNVDAAGTPATLSQHTGESVLAGSKWLASLWIRERPLA